MANTSYLRREVENCVREQLSAEYGQPFAAQFLPLTAGGRHEFDAVSGDGTIVASVKAASGLTAGGNVPSGKINDCLAELYYLSLVDASIRLLMLTTPAFFQIFVRKTAGAVLPAIAIRCVPLPPEIQRNVDSVVAAASKEVSPAKGVAAIAAEIESQADTAGP